MKLNILCKEFEKMGAEGLEPSRPCGQRIFILLQFSLLPFASWALRIGLSLYPRQTLRFRLSGGWVAPVESLHLPDF
ncbi:hypothetical protein OsccyDRAFT_3306 [Leptolyngbyaceae cyanobacterium JSC-12]|nr:hypothetical protein OsccyDRAFT_3306 [Leptolyngbyaceae cyanobacterium JSC-12]